jgi:hypothetical protein
MKKYIFAALIMVCIALIPSSYAMASTGINKKILTLNLEETHTLKLNVSGTIKWSVKNSDIATVSNNGEVTPKHPGVTYIYAKNNAKTYKCLLTVTSSDKDYLVYENDQVKVIYKGASTNSLCFEFINKTDNYYFMRVKSFTIDGIVYEHYLYDSTFDGPCDCFWNCQPGVSADEVSKIKDMDFKTLSGEFSLCLMDRQHSEVEAIDFSIDIK